MPVIPVTCRTCGGDAKFHFDQVALGSELRSWGAFSCEHCGTRSESDGDGELPDEYRQLLLRRDGEWSVVAEGPLSIELLQAVRARLQLSIQGLSALKASIPGPLASGTLCEMKVLFAQLEKSKAVTDSIKLVAK